MKKFKCMYCGKEIDDYGHNPEDFGLHTPYLDFSDYRTCGDCNLLVTITNRLVKQTLDSDWEDSTLEGLESHIHFLKDFKKAKNKK